ncbi:hypothetical protein [Gracilibacillus kekensis]|uniref:Lipid-A-disaccharide synthase n=1 Tax=Gracilibacillus kekensis TaxID=1027249 RepID=A0A1M7NT21_9BACI|nr:hypothetical protein [Gracilibacillus kekensis]SHN07263.1 hypothetical protein SAMN05216179_1750 [Gracilibacillus kekensis]
MDTFLKNYWSLYMDFLDDFASLTYRGFSLVYFCHLPSYVLRNPALLKELEKEAYIKNVKKEVVYSKDIQDKFRLFTEKHRVDSIKKHGKVAITVDKLLRFPKTNIHQQFSSADTVLLTNSAPTKSPEIKQPAKRKNKARIINTTIAKTKNTKKDKPTTVRNIPLYYLGDYHINVEKQIKEVQQAARKILSQNKSHHLYQNPTFQKWLLLTLASVITYMERTHQLLKKVNISCFVVSTTHSFINRILAVVGSKQGIPTICMQHGIISSELGYIPKIATVDAVYGQFEKDWYQKLGAKPGSIEIVGHPRFDQMYNRSKVDQPNFIKRVGLNKDRKTIMIAVRGEEDLNKWRQFIQVLNNKQKCNIIIKNYPSSQPHPLTKEFTNVYTIKGFTLYDIFPHVDAVITYSSTVGLEAMLSECVVFILDKSFKGKTGYYRKLTPLLQYDPKVLAEQLSSYLTKPSYRNYAEQKRLQFLRHAYPSKKRSFDRLKQLIKRLTN